MALRRLIRISVLSLSIFLITGISAALAKKAKPLTDLEIEQRLQELGFDPGPIDGKVDAKTVPALHSRESSATSDTGSAAPPVRA